MYCILYYIGIDHTYYKVNVCYWQKITLFYHFFVSKDFFLHLFSRFLHRILFHFNQFNRFLYGMVVSCRIKFALKQ